MPTENVRAAQAADAQDRQMCSWAITCPNIEDVVTLVFNVFETEAGHDLVTVYDGASKDGATMTALSGSLYELESRQ